MSNHCTEANSASNVKTPLLRLRIPKNRVKRARSISLSGISFASNLKNSNSLGSNETVRPSPVSSTALGETDVIHTSPLGTKSSISSEINHNGVLCVCQFFNISNPSSDEMTFLLWVRNFGLKLATFLAARFHLRHRRPLQALHAMMNESGKNYSARSAKRRPLSGALVSSRKRSSTA